MEAAYKTVPALHIKARWSARYSGAMSADDFPLPGPDSLELRMERPNKLYLSATSKRDGKQSSYMVVSDGTTLTYWKSATNSFIQKKAPETLFLVSRGCSRTASSVSRSTAPWEAENIVEWDLLADARAPSPAKTAAAQGAVLTMTGPEKLGEAQVNVIRLAAPSGALPFEIKQRYYLDAASHLLRGLATSARGKHPENGRDFTVEMRGVYRPAHPPSRPSAMTRSGSSRRAGRGREKAGRPHSCDKSLRESSPLTEQKALGVLDSDGSRGCAESAGGGSH